ncbi:hypothetical protein J2W32_006480 [Variovorax boronicumulans]|uniref:Shufflon system plasmid conjugative transfer pilus tip adhesin PilV n=1 Tax=Variovorax boronicumulans TaxID=436515 RepID=A0AAW8DB81_9BURK|nr:hypothetical protein [Variovorax boronicumulans]MDP9897363.1 hypothetical protein [Variovorax boronicumulans]MDQ0057403.1 hypothetical protein [Variovorax boronicumulans]
MKTNLSTQRRSAQSGFALLSALLALVVLAIVTAGQIEGRQTEQKVTAGRLQGDVLNLIKDAANNYTMENYPALQSDLPVTKWGVTLAPGATSGRTLAPSVANLIAMQYLPAGSSAVSQLNSGNYRVLLSKVPAGCVGPTCNISGMVYVDQPVRQPGTTNLAGVQIGGVMEKVGGDVLVSLQTNPGNLMGINGMTMPNPVGVSEGVIGARIGFGASGFGRFLVINDPRDPNFQGNLTVRQNLSIGGSSTFTGPVTVNNTLKTTGTIDVNNCIKLQPDGRGGFSCLDPNDLPPGYTGGIRAVDVVSSGNVLTSDAPASFTGTNGSFALLSRGGGGVEAMVKTSGQVAGNRLIPTGTYVPGSACSEPGAVGRSSTDPTGVMCSSSVWTPLAVVASAGGSCPVNGQGAVDAQGRQLYCFNGTWNLMLDFLPPATPGAACSTAGALGYQIPLIGAGSTTSVCRANPTGGGLRWFRIQDITTHLTFVTAYEVTHGAVVQKPACAAAPGQTSSPIPFLEAKVESSSDGGFARFTIDQGGSWLVQLTNGAGGALSAAPAASAILQIYCNVL